jgi:hypothetical protein
MAVNPSIRPTITVTAKLIINQFLPLLNIFCIVLKLRVLYHL